MSKSQVGCSKQEILYCPYLKLHPIEHNITQALAHTDTLSVSLLHTHALNHTHTHTHSHVAFFFQFFGLLVKALLNINLA